MYLSSEKTSTRNKIKPSHRAKEKKAGKPKKQWLVFNYNARNKRLDFRLRDTGFTPDEVKALKIHSLRHTSASLLIADGTDIRTVAARLGHSQTSTTLNIYAHAVAEANALAAKGLGNRLFGVQAEAPVSADKLPLT